MIVSTYILGFIIVILITYILYKIKESVNYSIAISKIPGPKGIPIIGNVLDLQSQEDIFEKLTTWSKEHGGIYKVTGANLAAIFISNPEDVEIIISGMKNLEKSPMYKLLETWLGTGLLTSTDEKWHTRRKILTPSFHFNILQQFTPTFFEKSKKLVDELDGLVDKTIDVIPLIAKYTLLTICETAMGTNMNEEEFENYRKAIHKMGELVLNVVVKPWFYLRIVYFTSKYFFKSFITARYLHKFSRDIIKKRQEEFNVDDVSFNPDDVYKRKKRLTLIDTLLYAKNVENNIDYDGIREEVDTFMFEGHDTTSSCMSFTLMLLANNKDIQNKAVEEINTLLPQETDQLSYEILNNMKYLERVIKESLRLYPSVPVFGRINNQTVITHEGYEIPPETSIMFRVYDMHRNPKLYPEPEKFDPDRFLPENVKERHPYAYIPFSAGPRNCIGQKFAMLELKSMIASVLRRFELLPVDTPETITLIADLILHSKNGIKIKFHRRN